MLFIVATLLGALILALAADLFGIQRRTPWGHSDPLVQVPAWIVLVSVTACVWVFVLLDASGSSIAVAVYRACQRWALPC